MMSLQQSPACSWNLSPSSNKLNLESRSFVSLNTHLQNPGISMNKSSGWRKSSSVAAMNSSVYAPPAEEETGSFYELLGISESGTLSEIKKAYKQLARKYHPDVSPAERAEEYTQRFILVQEAYETLSDPQSRALYDRDLSRGFHFAFSAARNRSGAAAAEEEMGEWKNRWESQLTELKRKSMYNNSNSNAHDDARQSWGARMRSQNRESQ
ncbi:hypothetical protein ACET3Z_000019 [Daucus carota]